VRRTDVFVPDGAYYVLADATILPGATAREKARALLAKTGVAAVAGSAFYSKGRVRICCVFVLRSRMRLCRMPVRG